MLTRFAIPAVMFLIALAHAGNASGLQDTDQYFRVHFVDHAGALLFSQPFDSLDSAQKYADQLAKDHGPSGVQSQFPLQQAPVVKAYTKGKSTSVELPPRQPSDSGKSTSAGGSVGSTTPDPSTNKLDLFAPLKEKMQNWVDPKLQVTGIDIADRITGSPDAPSPAKDRAQQFIGTWTGTLHGHWETNFHFLPNGDVIVQDKDKELKAKWVEFGANRIKFVEPSHGGRVFEGLIEDGILTGTVRYGDSGTESAFEATPEGRVRYVVEGRRGTNKSSERTDWFRNVGATKIEIGGTTIAPKNGFAKREHAELFATTRQKEISDIWANLNADVKVIEEFRVIEIVPPKR